MDKFCELLGMRIKQLRLLKELSQEELAHCSGLRTTQIGYIERGEKSCTISTLKKVADGLSVSMAELMQFDKQYVEGHINGSIQEELLIYLKKFDDDEQVILLDAIKNFERMKRTVKEKNGNI